MDLIYRSRAFFARLRYAVSRLSFSIVLLSGSMQAIAQVTPGDSLALLAIYRTLDGVNWTFQQNWGVTRVGDWDGVGIAGGRVVSLNLTDNGLEGPIPAALYDLTHLQSLSLGGNTIKGRISASIGQLERLRTLELSGNELVGAIPSEIGRLKNLRMLALAANDLSGTLPPELGELTGLQTLDLFGNDFSGEFPIGLSFLNNLNKLFLSYNQFSGPIPPEIRFMANLEVLRIERNQFSGELPAELALLRRLRLLDASFNQFSGLLPDDFRVLKYLEVLWLFNNQLTGGIPDSWGDMESLTTLQLSNNPLSGSLPASLIGLSKLSRLNLLNTNICVPQDTEMQAWLAGVPGFSSSGIACIATVIEGNESPPQRFMLESIYPNPASFQTTIRFGLPQSTPVIVILYDVNGRERLRVVDRIHPAGWHRVETELSDLPAGTYVLRLDAGDVRISRSISIVK